MVFYSTELHIISSNKLVLTQQIKDRLLIMRSSICVHQFNCFCGDSYTGHTQRALSLLAGEHVPACLAKGITKSVNSVIFSHLTDSEQNIKIDEACPIFYQALNNLHNGARLQFFYTPEAPWINS